jgi:hypothetical protein
VLTRVEQQASKFEAALREEELVRKGGRINPLLSFRRGPLVVRPGRPRASVRGPPYLERQARSPPQANALSPASGSRQFPPITTPAIVIHSEALSRETLQTTSSRTHCHPLHEGRSGPVRTALPSRDCERSRPSARWTLLGSLGSGTLQVSKKISYGWEPLRKKNSPRSDFHWPTDV